MTVVYRIVTTVILLQFKFASNIILPKLEECSTEIVNFIEQPYAFILFTSHDTAVNITQNIMNVSYVLINLNTIQQPPVTSWKPNLYVIVISKVEEYEKFLKMFYRTSAWNSRAIFIIIYLGNEEVVKMFMSSWKYYAIRVYILNSNLSLISYFPYKDGKCGDNLKPEVVYKCFENKTSLKKAIYTNHLPTHFNKCQFKVEALKIVPYIIATEGNGELGFEVQILQQLAHYANLTLIFLNHSHKSWGMLINNSAKFQYMFLDLYEKKTDAIAGMVPLANQLGFFDKTINHGFEKSRYFVPAGKKIEAWRNFLMIFDYAAWILFLATACTVCIALWFGGIILFNPQGHERLEYCIMQTFRATFSVIPKIPNSSYFRCVIIIWTCSCIILTNTYQSKLLTFLVKPAFEPEISSFEELLQSKLYMGGDITQLELAKRSEPQIHKIMYNKWINCSLSTLDCGIRAAEKRDFAIVQSERKTYYLIPKHFLNSDGSSKLKGLGDKTFTYLICFYLDLGLPYYDKFNRLISGLMENGLIHKWVTYFSTTRRKLQADEFVKLNLHHFILAFAILITGYLLAFCIFMVELLY